MDNSLVIGVDIGGTRTKYGLVKVATGEVLGSMILDTRKNDARAFLRQMETVISEFTNLAMQAGQGIAGVGIGVPGFTTEDGVVITTYGFLDFMENFPLRSIIEEEFSLPCRMDNDARVVSLGEALYGRGRGLDRVLTLTLGTGLGFGFVTKRMLTDPMPFAHMGGHISILPEGEACYCGKTGCLESLVSSTAILLAARKSGFHEEGFTVEALFAAALQGNETAAALVEKTVGYLRTGIFNYINLFAPDVIVLGGGISGKLEPYLKKIKSGACLPPYPAYRFKLAISTLQEMAGVLGGAAFFHSLEDENPDDL